MASAAGDPLASAKNLCADILDCCAEIQTVLLKLKESLRRKDAAVRLHGAVRGFLARQRARLLHGTKRTHCTSLQPSEVAAPLQIGTPVACWEPLAIVPRRDNIVGGLVLVVPLAICSEQQGIILRRGAITGRFGGFPWDPGEISITCMSELPGDYEGTMKGWNHGLHQTTTARGRPVFEGGGRCHG
ncbi:hypothetical protein PVAP13_5NG012538 [Panicum virgatum]|uniref:Uncharacterized protein n=1 Tax=Panicum virgatum TaxID=38727 RepID=A0A8T0S3N3_PANVG|nr:hypothetical protein PVAP13_5NG012538 [Panicum virgatum]